MKFTPWPPCTTVYQCTKFHYFSTYSSMGSHGLQWLNKKRGLGLNKKGYKFNAWPPINNLNTFNVFPPQSHPSTVSSCSVKEVGSSLSSQGFWSGLKDGVVSGSGPGPPFGGALYGMVIEMFWCQMTVTRDAIVYFSKVMWTLQAIVDEKICRGCCVFFCLKTIRCQ